MGEQAVNESAAVVFERDALGRVTGERVDGPGLEWADGVRYEHNEDGHRTREFERDHATWTYRWSGHGLRQAVERPDGARVEFA